ncbi:hypothetical protein [Kribbella sancticallisti]|uniref:hypothetical protein n=1 Tax=Kribbella sancticallisti TaxID=460087 RepID=UPI0031E39646
MGTAVVVVVGSLWVGVTPAAGELRLTAEVLHGVQARPAAGVDPRVAAAVDESLARRAAAVRAGDLEGFLADVTPRLKPDQTVLFQNLRALGMTVAYQRAERWDRYAPGAVTFRVSMRYVVGGSGLAEAATDVGYTYSVADGRAVLVDDTGLDQEIGSNRQPWDFGPIEVLRRPAVVVVVNKGHRALARHLADEAINSARVIRKIWPGQLQPVPLIVALREPQVLTDLPSTLPGVESATVRSMLSPEAGAVQPAGGWVVIRPGVQNTFGPAQMAHVLMHLLPVRLGDGAPRWLAEGMAEYAGKQALVAAGKRREVARQRVEIARRSLWDLRRLPPDAEFTAGDTYGISWLAVEQLVAKAGLEKVAEYYRQVARRGSDEASRERLLTEYTGVTEAQLVESLRELAN